MFSFLRSASSPNENFCLDAWLLFQNSSQPPDVTREEISNLCSLIEKRQSFIDIYKRESLIKANPKDFLVNKSIEYALDILMTFTLSKAVTADIALGKLTTILERARVSPKYISELSVIYDIIRNNNFFFGYTNKNYPVDISHKFLCPSCGTPCHITNGIIQSFVNTEQAASCHHCKSQFIFASCPVDYCKASYIILFGPTKRVTTCGVCKKPFTIQSKHLFPQSNQQSNYLSHYQRQQNPNLSLQRNIQQAPNSDGKNQYNELLLEIGSAIKEMDGQQASHTQQTQVQQPVYQQQKVLKFHPQQTQVQQKVIQPLSQFQQQQQGQQHLQQQQQQHQQHLQQQQQHQHQHQQPNQFQNVVSKINQNINKVPDIVPVQRRAVQSIPHLHTPTQIVHPPKSVTTNTSTIGIGTPLQYLPKQNTLVKPSALTQPTPPKILTPEEIIERDMIEIRKRNYARVKEACDSFNRLAERLASRRKFLEENEDKPTTILLLTGPKKKKEKVERKKNLKLSRSQKKRLRKNRKRERERAQKERAENSNKNINNSSSTPKLQLNTPTSQKTIDFKKSSTSKDKREKEKEREKEKYRDKQDNSKEGKQNIKKSKSKDSNIVDGEEEGEEEDQADETEYAVECILKHKIVNGEIEYLVKWEGYNEDEASWVNARDCHCQGLIELYHSKQRLKK